MKIIETNMSNGRDLVHEWNTIEEALQSGRFDYLLDEEMDPEEWNTIIKLLFLIYKISYINKLDYCIIISTTIEEFIENVGYPFSIE